jgi:hypothetical protein
MTTNPYSAPAATVADPAAPQGKLVPGGRGVAAGHGWTWIAQGWDLFKRQPALWIGIAVTLFVILLVLAFIPLLGPLVNTLLWPVLSAGLLLGCRALDEGGHLEFGHLFAGFRERFGTLITVGAITFGVSLAIGILVALVMGVGIGTMLGGGPGPDAAPEMLMTMVHAMLVMFALMMPLAMAMWFAPALVIFK